jgi:hypothetical protein
MNNERIESLTDLQLAQREIERLQKKVAQYSDDVQGDKMERQVISVVLTAMIGKYTQLCNETDNMTVRILCANIVQDCGNVLKVSTIPVMTLLE